MKKILVFLTVVALGLFSVVNAQNSEGKADDGARISITPQVNDLNIPAGAKKMLLTKMKQICTKNGLAGDGNNPFFVMDASVEILSKEIIPGPPAMHALNLSVSFFIKDAMNGNVYSEANIEVKGVGKNETKAYTYGLKNIKTTAGVFKAMVERGKTKILEFYNSDCDFIISKAQALHKQGNNAEAIKVLKTVPSVSKECYAKCMELLSEIEPPVEQQAQPTGAAQSTPDGSAPAAAPVAIKEVEIDKGLFLVYIGSKTLGKSLFLKFNLVNRSADDIDINDYALDTRMLDASGTEFKVESVTAAGKESTYTKVTIMNGTPVLMECEFIGAKSVAMFEYKYKGRLFRLKDLPVGDAAAATTNAVQALADAINEVAEAALSLNANVYIERDGETRFQYKEYAPGKIKTLASPATKGEFEVMAIADCSSDVLWTSDIITQWHNATKTNIKEGMTVLYTFYDRDITTTTCFNIGKVVALDEMYKDLVTIKGYSDDIKKVNYKKVLIVDASNVAQ